MNDGIRPRLLFLCQTLPYPPDGGVSIRTYNVMRLLARSFDITALCFYRRATRSSAARVQASIAGLRELAEVEAFPIPQEHSRFRLIWDHLRSVTLGRAYTVFAYESSAFKRRVAQLLEGGRFDLIHVDSLDLSAYLPVLRDLPVVCVHHNVESALLRRRAGSEASALRRRYVLHQADLLEREEKRWCGRVALNVAVSSLDAAALRRIVPNAKTCVVPNGVDTQLFTPEPGGDHGIVFVGGHSWYPNRDAMAYFCKEVLPAILARAPEATVRWVGRVPERLKHEYGSRFGVELTGYVDDIRPYVRAAACYVAPLRVGGGTRLKILDAWAMGKAVVSTTVGCEGLDARDGENILIRDEPERFADAVAAVLGDAALRERLGSAARGTAESRYSWAVIGEDMLHSYMSLLDGRASPRVASASAGTNRGMPPDREEASWA